jgi:hypothetical protein
MMKFAAGREARPPELDTFAAAFAVAGEKQEMVADQQTLVLLKRFPRNPSIEKARVEFDRAQKVEEQFHKDFDGVDFTSRQPAFKTDGPERKNCGYPMAPNAWRSITPYVQLLLDQPVRAVGFND